MYITKLKSTFQEGKTWQKDSGKNVCGMYTPHTPLLYIAKRGLTVIYLFFLFLIQNIDCGYSLGEAVLTCTHIQCFEREY